MKIYENVSELPQGTASDKIIPGCMVLEGGAWRGIYTQGALDCLMQQDINLQTTIGVSAGAMSGYSYVAGQIGRAGRINLTYRHDPRYVGLPALMANHGVTGFDFVFGEVDKLLPLDRKRFFDPARRFIAVATNCLDGKATYFDKDRIGSGIFKAIQASATVPYVSKMVLIDGIPYLDGGCAVKVPYSWALEQGFEKIIVIRTRDKAYRKLVPEKPKAIIRTEYRRYPAIREELETEAVRYNASLDQLDQLEKDGRVYVLAPSRPVTIRRFESDMEKLGALYHLGYDDAQAHIQEIKQYLGQ